MWQSSFTTCTNLVTHGLLCRGVLPPHARAFEKVSAALAVRAAMYARPAGKTLLFLVPEGTQVTSHLIAAGLLAGNYGHEQGDGNLPPEEVKRLLKGNLLLVTPAVSGCAASLESLTLGGRVSLTDLWDVVPLARHTTAVKDKPRVFLANPGWAEVGLAGAHHFAAVVIDATHPRTLKEVPQLLRLATGASSLRIVVAPPLPIQVLEQMGYPDKASAWLWDPQACVAAEQAVDERAREPAVLAPRTIRICDEDQAADDLLAAANRALREAAQLAAGRTYPGMPLARSIVNRLSRSTVPLAELEQAAARSWAGGLAERIQGLAQVSGHGDAAWDSTWPKIRAAVETAYEAFLSRKETAKFWALACRLEPLLRDRSATFRLVVPSSVEATLLTEALSQVVGDLPQALVEGRFEAVTAPEEARRIATGKAAHTLLLGPRPPWYRHLDLFPSRPVEEFCYPFEARGSIASLRRQYEALACLQGDARIPLLRVLGLPTPKGAPDPEPASPAIDLVRANGRPVTFVKEADDTTVLDLDALAAVDGPIVATGREPAEYSYAQRSGDLVEVKFSSGALRQYPIEHVVDVYFEETDQIQREVVTDLKPGWRVITFVDGHYDRLFQRTAEAIQERMAARDRVALELWEQGKDALATRYPNRKDLFDYLQPKGLSSSYATFCGWLRKDGDTVAPQQFEEFLVLARASGVYPSESLLGHTFECIQHLRGRNRAAGRKLKALLRAMLKHSGYEEALESVRNVDEDLADVFAAVDVLEVVSVNTLGKDQ